MATISQSAHGVERIVITPPQQFESGGSSHVSRQIVVKFSDGTEAVLDVYSKPFAQLPVEVQ